MDRERVLILLSRWRVNIGAVLAVVAVAVMQPTTRSIETFLPLALVGVSLRAWARGHMERTRYLARSGPYAFVRHPLYVGSFLIGLGIAGMSRSIVVTALYVVVFLAMYVPKAMREETYLATKFGDEWREYVRCVRAVVPIRRAPLAPGVATDAATRRFSWKRVLRHREWQTWLGLAAVLLAVWLHTRWP